MWGEHLIKVMKAVDLLSRPQGATNEELERELEVSTRTVFRLKNILDEFHFPVFEDEALFDGKKRWRLLPDYVKKLPNVSLPNIDLTPQDLIALYFIKGLARIYHGTEIEARVNAAYKKIGLFLPREIDEKLDQIRNLFIVSAKFTKDYSDKDEIINKLSDAMCNQATCLVEYHSFADDRVKKFKIDPLHFFERDGGLYLFVRTTDFNDIRILAVERIKDLSPTAETFTYPPDFNPEALLEKAFNFVYDDPLSVRIWFAGGQVRYIKERKWASVQSFADQPDGSTILSMDTSGAWDVKRWVLSFGGTAKILEPAWLQEELIAELEQALGNYEVEGEE